MSARNTQAWISFMKDVKESKGSAKVTEGMSSAELTSIATMLGCDISEIVAKRKIATKINQHLTELEEKSGEKYLAKLEGLDGGSIAEMKEEDPDAKEEDSDFKPDGDDDDDQGEKRPPTEPAEDDDEPKRLKVADDGEEEDTGDAMGQRKVASSSERLYEAKISPDSEIYQLEVASPLFATVRDDLVTKWGKIAGEVFDEMQREDIKWAEDMKFEQGSEILKRLEEIKVGKRYWPLFLSRGMLGLVNSAVVDTVVNKMAGARSLKEALKELKNVPTVYLTLSYSHGRKIRYRHLMIYLLRYTGMYKLKNPDDVIDINMPEHEHIRHYFQELLEGCGKGGVSLFTRASGGKKMMGADSMSSRGPQFQVSEQFDSFLEETLAMLSQVTDQVTEFKTKYNKHMSRAFAHGRKQGYDEGFKDGAHSAKDDKYVLVVDDDDV